ncbi:MAG: alpha/beta fold hydrolase [Allosphingosinicella sp.]
MDWDQPAGVGPRGSLLFCGGRGDFIEKYLEAYAGWHAAGWNVTAFDWRGQGRSQNRRSGASLASFDVMIEDLAALIADWRAGRSGPHVAVAHSMGGHMLLRTLVEKKPALDAAVLVAPMIRVNSAPMPEAFAPLVTETMCLFGRREAPVWKTSAGAARPGGSRQRYLTASDERYADELWWWDQEPAFNIGGVTWGWLRAANRSAVAFAPRRLTGVGVPVLLLGAERDRLVSAAAIREVAKALPVAELEMYPDAAHEILRDADPVRDRALARIEQFFAKHAR